MEMHQLRYFVKVAELKNFTRAAESCNVSQPSLSQQISKLERELGRPLFERLGRSVELTVAGEILYEHASRILIHVEEATGQIHDEAEAGKGRIAIGAIPTVAPFLLPNLLSNFTKQFPAAQVAVHELVTEEALRKCRKGDLDLILLARPFDETGLRVESLFTEELWLAVAKKHPLLERKRLTVEEIQTEQFILLDEAHCLAENILSFCSQRSFLPTVSCRGSQLQTVLELVSTRCGISLIPDMAKKVDKATSRVYRSLSGSRPKRQIVMAWNQHRFQSQLAKSLAESTRNLFGT